LKEKNMRRNHTVLVLLFALSLLLAPLLPSVAHASEFMDDGQDNTDPIEYVVLEGDGASGDDGEGDPGDAGDGYGVADNPDDISPPGGFGNGFGVILEGHLLLLMSLSQLVF
jgi:hypothetical protein